MTPQEEAVAKQKDAAAKKTAAERQKKLRDSLMTRGMKFLELNKDLLKGPSREQIERGDLQHVDLDFYIKRKINNAGSTNVLDTTSIKRIGQAYFDKNVLPEGYNMVIGAIRVAFGKITISGGTDDPTIPVYTNSGTFDPAIVNGEILVTVRDKPIIELPLKRFLNASSSAVPATIQLGYRDTIALEALKFLPEATPIKIIVSLADGATLANSATVWNYCEVDLIGIGTRPQ